MLRYFSMCVALAGLSLCLSGSIQAAEVGCDSIYKGSAHRNEETDRKLWPGGFRPVPGMCISGYLRGPITKGDFRKVRDLLAKNHPLISTVYLVSPGGDVDEAMQIGTLFRKHLIYAWAPMRFPEGGFYLPLADRAKCNDDTSKNCSCASACALIWLGAPERFGVVGLHRPRTTDPAFRNLPPAEASTVYKQKLDAIARYLNEVEVPRTIIDTMVATSSVDIRWVSSNDGLARAPSFAEWISASCGQISADERNTRLQLERRKATLASEEASLLKILGDKDRNINACKGHLVASSRERLSQPE